MPEIIEITTCRGAIKIAYEGYVYTKLRALANGYISYECDQRDKCFLNIMKKEQAITNLTLNQEAAGNVPDKPRKQYKLCAQRIKVLVETYSPDNIINFLRGVSHNLSF